MMDDGISDKSVKTAWESWGGGFHGPNVEHATIEEKRMYSFAREMYRRGISAAHRPELENKESEQIPKLECGMGCGRTFASPEGRAHHEELCRGPALSGINHGD